MTTPLTREEFDELLNSTTHGPLPQETVLRLISTCGEFFAQTRPRWRFVFFDALDPGVSIVVRAKGNDGAAYKATLSTRVKAHSRMLELLFHQCMSGEMEEWIDGVPPDPFVKVVGS